MKSWPDRFRELPLAIIKENIDRQIQLIKIQERDLETMRIILAEKESKP